MSLHPSCLNASFAPITQLERVFLERGYVAAIMEPIAATARATKQTIE